METNPLSPWSYFGLEILYSIPIVGFIFLIIHAIGAKNVNKRNFARSYFCFIIVVAVIIVVVLLITGGTEAITRLVSTITGK